MEKIVDGMFRMRGIETVKLEAVRELLQAADAWAAAQMGFGYNQAARHRADAELLRRIEHWRRVRDLKPKKVEDIPKIPIRLVGKDKKNPRKKRAKARGAAMKRARNWGRP